MKTSKLSLIVFAAAMLQIGAVQAVTVTPLNTGDFASWTFTAGAQAVTYGDGDVTPPVTLVPPGGTVLNSSGVAFPDEGDYNLMTVSTGGGNLAFEGTASQTAPILVGLNLEIYEASAAGGSTYSTGTLRAQSIPAVAGTPLNVVLEDGIYLVRLFGALLGNGSTTETGQWQMSLTSVVPVPAAVWLFGTAMLGLFGMRRKSRLESATA